VKNESHWRQSAEGPDNPGNWGSCNAAASLTSGGFASFAAAADARMTTSQVVSKAKRNVRINAVASDLKEFYRATRWSNNHYFFITLYPCLSSMLKIWII
jgi:hypothetical protein